MRAKNKARKHAEPFTAVLDSRKRKVPALWRRGDRFYGQLRVAVGGGKNAPRKIPLEARTLEEARAALERLRTENRDGKLPTRGFRPTLEAFAQEYQKSAAFLAKKIGTQENEEQALIRWAKHIGGVRVDKITPAHIHAFREKRLNGDFSKDGKRPESRTVNLDTVALRNCLKFAVEREYIAALPEVAQLKEKPPRRKSYLSVEHLAALLDAVAGRNATQFRLYLRFLALTGAREQEALQVRWSDVDMAREVIAIGSGGASKNHKARTVNFSPDLRALLEEMAAARPPDTQWLFPSPQRGKRDTQAKTFRESLNEAREKAGLAWVGFHDLRHMFASRCVMAGIDYMTIAEWLGHSDGGILVGKVYGHLADTHKKQAAQKLRLYE